MKHEYKVPKHPGTEFELKYHYRCVLVLVETAPKTWSLNMVASTKTKEQIKFINTYELPNTIEKKSKDRNDKRS